MTPSRKPDEPAGDKPLVDSRDRDLARSDLANNYIVEAAAGTGKTTLLVDRILNLIIDLKATPDDIVAITFTERAAAELKMKLQNELGKALKRAQERGGDGPRERVADPAAPDDVVAHLAGAMWGFERMQVTTIHSFCAALLRERPVEAGIDPNFEVADGLRASLIAEETWEDWLAREMDRDDPALRRAVLLGVGLDNMYELARAMVENRDMLGHLPEPLDLDKVLADYASEFKTRVSGLEEVSASGCKDPQDKAALAIQDLKRIAAGLDATAAAGKMEDFVLEKLDIKWQARWGAKGKWSSGDLLDEARAGIEAIKEIHAGAGASVQHNALAGLAQKLLGYVRAYESAKDREEMLDFQDLLLFARNLLAHHPEVRRYFSRKYRYILVDEFQDTDPLQAEIIFFLSEKTPGKARAWEEAEPEPGKVFLVGDPKQSIYRFRRADIEMYAAAKAGLGKKRLLSIHQNFRCAPSIVDSVNAIFADLIQASTDGNYQPEYVPLHFGRVSDTVPERQGVVLIHPTEEIAARLEKAHARRTYEARAIAAFIKDIIADAWWVYDKEEERIRPVEPRDIAILMETHSPLPFLEEAMRLYEIDYRVIGGKYFYSRQEVQQLVAVLRAIENPYDTVAILAALRSPFFGLSDEEIFLYHCSRRSLTYLEDAGGTSLVEAFDLLADLHHRRNDMTVEELLHSLYTETRAPVTYLLKPNGEQRVANLLKIADTARALYDRGVCTLRGFVAWLKERESQETEEAEAITVETGDNFVRILTMHKAKGLEFPVTILTDLARVPKARTERLIIDRVGGGIALSVGRKSGIKTGNFESLKEYEDRRSAAEELRLLYVSMTRARDFLVLPAYWAADTERLKGGELRDGSMMKTLAGHVPVPEGFEVASDSEGKRGTEDEAESVKLSDAITYDTSRLDLEPKIPPAFRIPLAIKEGKRRGGPVKLSASGPQPASGALREIVSGGRALSTPTGEIDFEAGVHAGDPRESRPAGGDRNGASFGTLVHTLLEKIDLAHPGDVHAVAYETAEEVGVSPEMASQAADMVNKALRGDVMKRVLKADTYYREVPFAIENAGAILEGKIDVLFREGDDLCVIDFKTDRVADSELKAKAEFYRPQAEAYARAVRLACGCPPREVLFFFLQQMKAVNSGPDRQPIS